MNFKHLFLYWTLANFFFFKTDTQRYISICPAYRKWDGKSNCILNWRRPPRKTRIMLCVLSEATRWSRVHNGLDKSSCISIFFSYFFMFYNFHATRKENNQVSEVPAVSFLPGCPSFPCITSFNVAGPTAVFRYHLPIRLAAGRRWYVLAAAYNGHVKVRISGYYRNNFFFL